MGRRKDISIEEAAQIMKKEAEYIRYGLQQERLKFGSAVQKPNGRWSYNIVFKVFCEYMGETEEEVHKQVKKIREKEEEKKQCIYLIKEKLRLEL